jgi:aminomuconate-semialdehyde/2-hydroxymuconate-6-semialdehyde dehydrogenase
VLGVGSDADRAVAAARKAFDEGPWPRMGFAERQTLLHRLADLMDEHAEELALADSHDMGKPITQALHDVARSRRRTSASSPTTRDVDRRYLPMDSGHHAYSRFEPAGVVVAIAPWNFPLMLETWKVAPALAWGNTVVLKPAEDTPRRDDPGRLAIEAGIPPACSTSCTATARLRRLGAHRRTRHVDRITFTGESGTGRIIAGPPPATS